MTNSRKARIRRQRQRRALLTMALVLVTAFACIGGTIAWLTAETGAVTNTFTVGDINIELMEHTIDADGNTTTTETDKWTYKMVPGTTLNKDPFVTVNANSEDCFVFVEVVEANNTNADAEKFIEYTMGGSWIKTDFAPKHEGVVYKYKEVVTLSDSDKVLDPVLANDQVTVNDDITKEDMEAVTTNPTLQFYAYAVQEEGSADAADAWAKLNG